MSEPFIGQIKIFAFSFAPRYWAKCDGQLLPINQNQALFSLMGTTYGGNGQTTFALPDLRSRVPNHYDNQFRIGVKDGTETHTMSMQEMPAHTHQPKASSSTPSLPLPTNNYWASGSGVSPYGTSPDGSMAPETIGNAGGNQAHENRSPFLILNFCIALQGLYPSRS